MKLISEYENSELARWADEGFRYEPKHSNIVTYRSPDKKYNITVEVDDLVEGCLVKLYRRHGVVPARAIIKSRN